MSRMSAPSEAEPQPVRDGGVGVEELPAVRERVGRHVHHSHDQHRPEYRLQMPVAGIAYILSRLRALDAERAAPAPSAA